MFFVKWLMKLQRFAALLLFSSLLIGCSLPPDPLQDSSPAAQKPGSNAEPALQSTANNGLPAQSGLLTEPTQQAGKQTPESDAITVLPVESSSIELTPSHVTTQPAMLDQIARTQSENSEPARKDLAQRLGIPVEEISVLSVIGQEFSKIAFYCQNSKDRIAKVEPEIVISGNVILLEARGNRYEYHVSSQEVVYCRRLF